MNAKHQLRVGLIGCGSVALSAHIPALLNLLDDYQVAAVADPTQQLRKRARELLGLPAERAYDSHVDLLARDDIDVALVCTPPNVRVPIILDAVASGRHVLSRSRSRPSHATPTPPSLPHAALESPSASSTTTSAPPRNHPCHALLEAGEIGTAEVALLNYLGVLDNPGSSDYQPGLRRRVAVAGGGVLMDMLHVVYVAEHLLGEPIEQVSAWVSATEDRAPVEEFALCRFETETKAALVNIGWGFGPGGIQVSGSEGRLIVRYHDDGTSPFFPPETVTVSSGERRAHFEVGTPPAPTHRLALEAFARAIRTGAEPDATGKDGARWLSAVLAAYASAIANMTVAIPFPSEDPVYLTGAAGLPEIDASPMSHAVRLHMFGVDEAASNLLSRQEHR